LKQFFQSDPRLLFKPDQSRPFRALDQQLIHLEQKIIRKKRNKDKKFSGKISCARKQEMISGLEYEVKKMKLYLYDIPKKYKDTKILAIMKTFGEVSSYEKKRLHKYQLIRAEIFLSYEWKNKRSKSNKYYITGLIDREILNLRYVYASIKKAEVDESWKKTVMIKTPDYYGKHNNLKGITEYLSEKKMYIPFMYGKNIIIQGKLYFWAIFGYDC
jgi:hypothetical protein